MAGAAAVADYAFPSDCRTAALVDAAGGRAHKRLQPRDGERMVFALYRRPGVNAEGAFVPA